MSLLICIGSFFAHIFLLCHLHSPSGSASFVCSLSLCICSLSLCIFFLFMSMSPCIFCLCLCMWVVAYDKEKRMNFFEFDNGKPTGIRGWTLLQPLPMVPHFYYNLFWTYGFPFLLYPFSKNLNHESFLFEQVQGETPRSWAYDLSDKTPREQQVCLYVYV